MPELNEIRPYWHEGMISLIMNQLFLRLLFPAVALSCLKSRAPNEPSIIETAIIFFGKD